MVDVKSTIVLIVAEKAEQLQGGPLFNCVPVLSWEEQYRGLFRGDALKIIKDGVRPDVRKDLANAGQEKDIELLVSTFAQRWQE